MIAIEETLVSDDIIKKAFVCNLNACKGECCVAGDSGAPLEKDEIKILKDIFPKIKSYIPAEGIAAIEAQGVNVIDEDGDDVTTLVDGNKHCAFVYFDETKTAKCSSMHPTWDFGVSLDKIPRISNKIKFRFQT